MNMKIKNMKWMTGSLMTAALTAGISACSDDHFDLSSEALGKETIWQNIQANEQLSDFADILQNVYYSQTEEKTTPETYADLLNGDQTFTVWAPINGSFDYAYYKELLASGNRDNIYKVEKELIRNCMTRYSNIINGSGTKMVDLFNAKKVELDYGNLTIKGTSITTPNIGASNGVLHITSTPIEYEPNLYEFLGSRENLDSINNFIKSFQTSVFNENASTQGPTINGYITWVDSVTSITNDYTRYYMGAYLDREDSTYAMIIPTDDVWKELLKKTKQYFQFKKVYEQDINTQTEAGADTLIKGRRTEFTQAQIDSLNDLYAKNAICQDLAFNAKWQYEQTPISTIEAIRALDARKDSLRSTAGTKFKKTGTLNETNSNYVVEIDNYADMFGNADPVKVSNGYAYVVDKFPYPDKIYAPDIDELNYESHDNACEISHRRQTYTDPKIPFGGDTIQVDSTYHYTYVVMTGRNTSHPGAYFKMSNVLSCKYDIYVVIGYNTEENLLNKFNAYITYDTKDKRLSSPQQLTNPNEDAVDPTGASLYKTRYFTNRGYTKNTKGEIGFTDTICIAKDFQFPVCYYGISSDAYPTIFLKSTFTSRERSLYCREIWVNSIILKSKEAEVALEPETDVQEAKKW